MIRIIRRFKLGEIATLIGLYIVLIGIINTFHFQFLTVRVVLYDTLVDVIVAGFITLLIYTTALRQRLSLSETEGVLALFAGFLIGVNYAISVPTIIDRSLSIYILEKIEQRGGGIRRDAFDGVFKNEYVQEHRLVDIRLTEQVNSGTIQISDGCVTLTDRGKWIVAFTRFYRTSVLPKHREIMGEYTDVLTDPFRNSVSNVDYTCVSRK